MDSPKVLILPESKLIRPRLTLLQNTFRGAKAPNGGRRPHFLEVAERLHPPANMQFIINLLDELNLMTTVVLEPHDTVLLYPLMHDQPATDRLKTFLMLRHITYFESKAIREDDLIRRKAAEQAV